MMKKISLMIICILCLSIILCACVDTDDNVIPTSDNSLTVMSYNIRCFSIDGNNNEEVNGLNYIENRIPRILSNVEEENPDLIGFQEYTAIHNAQLSEALGDDYDSYVVYRDEPSFPNALFPEATPIFWRKSRFELLDKGAFWFTDTPDQMSVFKYVDENGTTVTASHKRVTTWVKLLDNQTNKSIVYFNTHLGLSEQEKEFSINLLRERAMKFDCPVIVTGDMNIQYDSELSIRLTEGFNDASKCSDNMRDSCTYQGYGSASKRLDYILSKGLFAVTHKVRNNDTELYDGAYASDHFAVIAKLVLA